MEMEDRGNERSAAGPDPFVREEIMGVIGEEEGGDRSPGRPTWKALVLAVVAAIVLSISATLLLGGASGFTRDAAPAGCGPGSACCPPADSRSAGR